MTYGCPEFDISTEKELVDCLGSLRQRCIDLSGTDVVVDRAFEYWNIFKDRIYFDYNKKLQIPDIIFHPDIPEELQICFYWTNEDEYMYGEIYAHGNFALIYENQVTKEGLGEDYWPGENEFPEAAFELLLKFVKG